MKYLWLNAFPALVLCGSLLSCGKSSDSKSGSSSPQAVDMTEDVLNTKSGQYVAPNGEKFKINKASRTLTYEVPAFSETMVVKDRLYGSCNGEKLCWCNQLDPDHGIRHTSCYTHEIAKMPCSYSGTAMVLAKKYLSNSQATETYLLISDLKSKIAYLDSDVENAMLWPVGDPETFDKLSKLKYDCEMLKFNLDRFGNPRIDGNSIYFNGQKFARDQI